MADTHFAPEPSRSRGLSGPPLSIATRAPSPEPYRDIVRETANPLGTYLRARRELTTPQQAGIPSTGVRRVPGLRREEVAMLAGISADYYLRLERGRDRNPSAQVLESLARVFQLDYDHVAHLHSLVAKTPAPHTGRPPLAAPPASALKLLDSLAQPAFIEGKYFDVVASNALARALSPRLTAGRNQLRDLLLDPEEKSLYPDWDTVTECMVASLRHAVGNDVDDPQVVEFAGELSMASPRFRQLWSRHEVRAQRGAALRIDHPQVREITLNRERLAISGAAGLMLVVYHPDAVTSDADKLALLASADLPASQACPALETCTA